MVRSVGSSKSTEVRVAVKRLVPLAILSLLALALAAPAGAFASADPNGARLAHTYLHVRPNASSSPTGLSPATMKSVYGFSTDSAAGAGKTIAIVDAYDLPTAENDLNVFSAQFGLPACTAASGCFKKVNQTGGTSYPRKDAGWGLEIALDIEWAHAIAPGAKILLVEASSNSFTNLLAAEDYARAHADYVSNSWGASEFSGETGYDAHFAAGKTFVSAGDNGTPAEYPSSSPNVISVGGTTLHFSGSTFTGETGWSGGGGGCSVYEAATSAQSSFSQYGQVNCAGKRATPDLSLDADPASGASVYDSTRYLGQSGWWTVGGTSLSSPMAAGHAAVLGVTANAAYVYGAASSTFRDITSGNNGASCLVGYDLCSGRGSWLN
jgi:subtilase family serine protease